MKLAICLIIYFAMATGSLRATDNFAGNDCVHCGGEGIPSNKEVSADEVMLICQTARSGMFGTGRSFGKRVYGSLEEYYNRFDQIDCSGAYRNPVILGVEQNILKGKLLTELEKIEEHMDEEMIDYIINMPSRNGELSRTVMDIATNEFELATNGNNPDAAQFIRMVLTRLERLGAKKLDDLSPEQRSRYSGVK